MNKDQAGFGVIEILLVVIVVGVLGATGWYALRTKHQTDQILAQSAKTSQNPTSVASSIDTFSDCEKAVGSYVEASTPRICTTVGNIKFTEVKKPISQSIYLAVKELGVKFKIPDNLQNMSYTYDPSSPNAVALDSKTLTSLAGNSDSCKLGGAYLGWLTRRITKISNGYGAVFIRQLGKFYYYYSGPQQACLPPEKPNAAGVYPSSVSSTAQTQAQNQMVSLLQTTLTYI